MSPTQDMRYAYPPELKHLDQLASRLSRELDKRLPATPRLTDWTVTGTGSSTGSVDVADILSLGAAYVAPVNVNVAAGVVEVHLRNRVTNASVVLDGLGFGSGFGLGWSAAPFGATTSGSTHPLLAGPGVETSQGRRLPPLSPPGGGIGRVVTGPKAGPGALLPHDFNGFMTVFSGEGSAVLTGGLVSVILFSDHPLLFPTALRHVKAVAATWGLQLGFGSAGISAGGMNYICRVR